MSERDLTYKAKSELETFAGSPASGDLSIIWDNSEGEFRLRDATLSEGEATTAEIDRIADVSARTVTVTNDTTLVQATHEGKTVVVNKADGAAITLPAASVGDKYTIIIGTTISSNSTTIKVANASDSFTGMAIAGDTDAEGATGYTWNADSGDDTITLDGAATGGVDGDKIEIECYAANKFNVFAKLTQSGGSEVTPFSATVS